MASISSSTTRSSRRTPPEGADEGAPDERSSVFPRRPLRSLRGPLLQRAGQRALRIAWDGAIPLLLTCLALRFFVPAAAPGILGAVASVVHAYPVPFGIALFFVFAFLSRYWRFHIPGGRYASPLPAQIVPHERNGERLRRWSERADLYEVVAAPRMQQRFRRQLDRTLRTSLLERLDVLAAALESGDELAAESAARDVESLTESTLVARRRADAFALVALVGMSATIALLARANLIERYRVLSASMLPTLEPGDDVIGNRIAYHPLFGPKDAADALDLPERGDVVVFRANAVPLGLDAKRVPDVLVKRVIGLPGDHITMNGGVPSINGWSVPYCDVGLYLYVSPDAEGGAIRGKARIEYLGEQAYLTLHGLTRAFEGVYVVKPEELFVLGDNRSNSLDSRAWNEGRGGGVPFVAVDARVQWFLLGSHRDGDPDVGRLFRPLDALTRDLHVEGLDAHALQEGIARCLSARPKETSPPPFDVARASSGAADRGT